MVDERDFSLRLAKLRTRMGASARDMSLSIGQNPGYINNIETGKALPSMSAFFCICDYLHITPSEFFDEELTRPEKLKRLNDNLKTLDDRQLYHIASLVDDLALKK